MNHRSTLTLTNIIRKQQLRTFSVQKVVRAGFQGGNQLSMALRQSQIDRKKRKIVKLEKLGLNEIPIVDFFIPYSWKQPDRARKLADITEEEREERALLLKQWNRYTMKKRKEEEDKIKIMMEKQTIALQELRAVSEELYLQAMQPDYLSLGYKCRGPVQSMPLQEYLPPLGAYDVKDPPFNRDDTAMPSIDD